MLNLLEPATACQIGAQIPKFGACACHVLEHLEMPNVPFSRSQRTPEPQLYPWNLSNQRRRPIEWNGLECWHFLSILWKRCPLTRDAQLKKSVTWLRIYPACCAPMQLNLTYFVDKINPNTISAPVAFQLLCKQSCGSFSKLIFNRRKIFFGVQVWYAGLCVSSIHPGPRFVCRWSVYLQMERKSSKI